MLIEYDPAKDRLNLTKHGVSFACAAELDWDTALIYVDGRYHYDEPRMSGLVPHGSKLYFVAFVDRGDRRRIISLRRANRNEVKYYVENQ